MDALGSLEFYAWVAWEWAKAHPFLAVAILIGLVAVGYFAWTKGASWFRQWRSERYNRQVRRRMAEVEAAFKDPDEEARLRSASVISYFPEDRKKEFLADLERWKKHGGQNENEGLMAMVYKWSGHINWEGLASKKKPVSGEDMPTLAWNSSGVVVFDSESTPHVPGLKAGLPVRHLGKSIGHIERVTQTGKETRATMRLTPEGYEQIQRILKRNGAGTSVGPSAL